MPIAFQHPDRIADFLGRILDATRSVAKAYKINTAFFEQYGIAGIQALYDVREMVADTCCIIDAKRADIGNTSAAYATALFDELQADAVTVAPYMGYDSIAPFMDRGLTYLLALTSNPGSADFQRQLVTTPNGNIPLYLHVMQTAKRWKGADQLGFVVGATHAEELARIRVEFPTTPFLIPGIGTQGGDAASTAHANGTGPALFNVSRAILYSSDGHDFAEAAEAAATVFAAGLSH